MKFWVWLKLTQFINPGQLTHSTTFFGNRKAKFYKFQFFYFRISCYREAAPLPTYNTIYLSHLNSKRQFVMWNYTAYSIQTYVLQVYNMCIVCTLHTFQWKCMCFACCIQLYMLINICCGLKFPIKSQLVKTYAHRCL